jgi:hypothetical protein
MTEDIEDDIPEDSKERKFEYPPDFLDAGLPKGVISPSQFGMYKRCPRQYEYAYVKGIRRPPGISMLKGTAIHKGAEVVHKHTIATGQRLSMEAAVQEVADEFEDGLENVEKDPEVNVGEVKDRTLANFRIYYVQAVPLIRPVAAEETFAIKIGTVPMRGVIDLIDHVPGDVVLGVDDPDSPPLVEVVSDLKTTTKKWTDQMVNHSVQMTIYSLVKKTPFVRVDLLIDQKSGTKYLPIRATRSNREKQIIVEDVEEMAMLVKKGVFPRCLPDSWVCTQRFCGYYAECRGPK